MIHLAAISVGLWLTVADTCPTQRMPYEQSQAIKRSLLPPGGRMADYELDHIIPLCLCGSNDRSNLQLQPWSEARRKDAVEQALCEAVGRGDMSHEEAIWRLRGWRP